MIIPEMVNFLTLSGINERGIQAALETLPYLNKATLSTLIGKRGEALNYWVKRLVGLGEIIPLKRGLFAARAFLLKVKGQPLLFDKYREYLAGLMRSPSYISLEYALAKYGALAEVPFAITSITIKSTRNYSNKLGSFVFRNIKQPLFCGYREENFGDKRYFVASPAKALFDYVYLRKFQWADDFEAELEEGMRINWDVFKRTDIKELKNYAELSGKRKMELFINIITRRRLI